MFGYSGFFLCIMISWFLAFLSRLYIPGSYYNNHYYGNIEDPESLYFLWFKIGFIFWTFGFLVFILSYEINFRQTRFLLTIFFIPLIILEIIFPWNTNFTSIVFLYALSSMLFVLVKYTEMSQLEFKALSSYMSLGVIIFGYASSFTSPEVMGMGIVPIWLAPLFCSISGILVIYPILTSSKNYSRTFKYWIILGFLTIILHITFLFIYIFYGFPIQYTGLVIFFLVVNVCIQYLILKDIRSSITKGLISREIEPHVNVLGTLARPKDLTEEEVAVSKEKKICLVCKGKVVRFNSFICECDTIYCQKCAYALSDLENACWVCETPFDESKPVKLPEKREEEIKIDERDLKKKGEKK